MQTKNVITLGALALLAILGMRSCDRAAAPVDAAKSAAKEVVKEAEKAKDAVVEKVAKVKESTTPAAKKAPAHKKPTHKKVVRKAAVTTTTEDPNARAPEALVFDHNKSNRYTFGGDNTK